MKKTAEPHARPIGNADEAQGAYVIPARTARPRQALIDEFVRQNMELREVEQRLRERRAEAKQGGRVDLARKFLQAPAVLRDLAGFLWRDEPLGQLSNARISAKSSSSKAHWSDKAACEFVGFISGESTLAFPNIKNASSGSGVEARNQRS
jgi:hypothetical protein